MSGAFPDGEITVLQWCFLSFFFLVQVTEEVKKVADAYGVKFVSGTQMEQITRCGRAESYRAFIYFLSRHASAIG